jgi:hypothetical protein
MAQVSRLIASAASDNATQIHATFHQLRQVVGYNARTSAVYLKVYDKNGVPASTDTPIITLYLPASSAFEITFHDGVRFSAGMGYRLTTGGADNDTSAIAANDILALNFIVE